jgi:hypothetical protein
MDNELKPSFIPERVSDVFWQITTNSEYAPFIEDGGNDVAFFDPARGHPRSKVGGYHSAKLTEASWDLIVDDAAKQVAGQ